MEGVEDIPGTALHEEIRWGWESFPEYLDALDAKPMALDFATQIPHGAVRPSSMTRSPSSVWSPRFVSAWHKMFRLSDPPDYELSFELSFAGIAEREGRHPKDVAYDALLEDDGGALLYHPLFNYLPGDLSYVYRGTAPRDHRREALKWTCPITPLQWSLCAPSSSPHAGTTGNRPGQPRVPETPRP